MRRGKWVPRQSELRRSPRLSRALAWCYIAGMESNSTIIAAEDRPARFSSGRLVSGVLGGGGMLLFLAAGGLLWWRHGDAVFSDFALSGLAWCF
jgi:hypothetical protein